MAGNATRDATRNATRNATYLPGQKFGVAPIDPATLDPYLYFRADPAAGGSITTVGGAVSEWSQVTTSGGNQINRTLAQGTANQQPQHDNTDKHITFDDTDDDLLFTLSGSTSGITQAGTLVSATSSGIWAFDVNDNAQTDINALGYDTGHNFAVDQYALILFPTLTDNELAGVVAWLEENTNATKTAPSAIRSYNRTRSEITALRPNGIDVSSTTDFSSAWQTCVGMTSFPALDVSSGTDFGNTWRDCSGLTSFPSLNVSSGTNFATTWFQCSSLASFPLLNTSSGTHFTYTWYKCSSLTSFPLLNTSSGTDFQYCWYECTGLTSFPLLDTSSSTSFDSTWRGCTSLTSFPSIDTSSGSNFHDCWRGCTGLTSFPALDTSSGTSFNSAWRGCTSLTSFPSLTVSSGTIFLDAWRECTSLTSFPALDVSSGTNFKLAWYGCTGLTSFPSLTVSSGTNFQYAWRNCSGLTSFPSGFFDSWNPSSILSGVFNETWDGCSALTATSVENILVSIAASGKHGTDDGSSSGTALADATIDIDYNASTGSLSAATNTAINTLISRGWSVEINGVLTVPSLLALSPAAAYSLRSFDSSADPNVVNVRRSSDNATQDFKASEITDGTLATYVGSGNDGFIANWYDQTGNNEHASQTTASQQPKIVSSGTVVLENSKPAIDFDGSDDELALGNALLSSTSTRNYSAVFTTSATEGVVVGGNNKSFYNTYGNAIYVDSSEIKAKALSNSNGVLLDSGVTPSGTFLATAEIISGSSAFYVNGVQKATDSDAPQTHSYVNYIGGGMYTGDNLDGTIQEIVIYNADQSANRTPIENNINTHYSIY